MDNFEQIDARRAAGGLTRKQVYEAAGLHKETWRRIRAGKHSPNVRTLQKLNTALDDLLGERHENDE